MTTITVTTTNVSVPIVTGTCALRPCCSSNGRYLVNEYGTPIFMSGDTPWSLISQCTTAERDTYLMDRASRGFNAAFCFVIDHMFCTNAPNNIYNEPPFTSTVFTTPNEDYFARVDSLISKAQQLDICMFLAPLYIGYPGTEEGWDTEIAAASTSDMQSWGTYLGNRYKNYPNIIWVLGGDRIATAFLAKINSFANALITADPNHLVTFHDLRPSMAIDNLAGASWCNLNDIYTTYLTTTTWAHTAYNVSPAMPYIQIEGYYEGEYSMTDQQLRAQAYWTILGGGCGHLFGNNPVWGFTYLDANWATYLGSDGAIGMTRWASLFRSKAWYNLVPDYGHSVLTVGYGTEGNADYAACGRVADGSLIMIYMPSNRTMTVDMTKMSGSTICRWYDPYDGSYATDAASPLSNTGTHDFSHAGTNSDGDADWVLVLEAA